MGRKTKVVQIPRFELCDNRDLGKTFLITEWSARDADNWIQDITFAANQGGGSIPLEMRGIGWEGIAVLGINTFLRGNIKSEEMRPLFDRLLECVQVIRDPKHPDVASPIVSDDDIEEVATRWWLRNEVVSVHVNFSPLGALSTLWALIRAKTLDSEST